MKPITGSQVARPVISWISHSLRKGKERKKAYRYYVSTGVSMAESLDQILNREFFRMSHVGGRVVGWLPTRGRNPRPPLMDALCDKLGCPRPLSPQQRRAKMFLE